MSENVCSIVVPHYNNGVEVKRLVESILKANKSHIEILIIDDKSNVEEYKELIFLQNIYPDNVRVYSNDTPVKGAGVCRNIGIEHVTSDWVIFADSDDHFLDGYWSKIECFLNTDYEIIYFFPTSQDNEGRTINRHNAFVEPLKEYLRTNNINDLKYRITTVWSKMYKTAFIRSKAIQFDETMVSNDVMFAVKGDYYANNIFVSKETFYSWDLNTSSLTTKMSKERFEIVVDVIIKQCNFIKEHVQESEYILRRMSGFKLIVFSLIRYKYGIKYTINLIKKLNSAGISIVNVSDFEIGKVRRFLQNNSMYQKA